MQSYLKFLLIGTLTILFVTCSTTPIVGTSIDITPLKLHQKAQSDDFTLWWRSSDYVIPTLVESGSELIGDQITVNGEFRAELQINRIELGWSYGFYKTFSDDLVIPTSEYNPLTDAIDLDEFAWVQIDDIQMGEMIRFNLTWESRDLEDLGDCDVMAWWSFSDNSSWTYANNLLSNQMVGDDKPKSGSYFPTTAGSITVGIYDNSSAEGLYTLTVDTLNIGWYYNVAGDQIEYVLGNDMYYNATITLVINGYTGDEVRYVVMYRSLTLLGVFAPTVTAVSVSGPPSNPTISWSVEDKNEWDYFRWMLSISSDGGLLFRRLIWGEWGYSYEWDASEYEYQEYIFRVIVTDSTELQGAGYSEPYYAGAYFPFSINSPSDLHFIVGTPDKTITWTPVCNESLGYRLFRDGLLLERGTWTLGDIVVSLDDLEVGIYSYNLVMYDLVDNIEQSDEVIVEVLPSLTSGGEIWGEESPILWGLSIGITLGSIALIGLVCVLIINAKREGKGRWNEDYQFEYADP
ncbi:MAG: hypothetical protein ACFFF4_02755 [Candidatus Thorarchaeota archaeon]